MFDACFIVETLNDKKNTERIITIVKKFGVKQIIPFCIENITKEQLVHFGDAAAPFANLESNDLNNLIKYKHEKRMLTLQEIKHYLEHKTAWKMIQDKKFNQVLILDNSIQLKEEFQTNFVEKITEIIKNAHPLYSIISLIDSSKTRNVIRKCNEFFHYPDVKEQTHMAYIITRIGVKKMLKEIPLSPIIGPIPNIINECRLFQKDIFIMKNPIFDFPDIPQSEPHKKNVLETPKRLSLPVKQVQHLFKKVYIVNKNKNEMCNKFLINVSLITLKFGISCYIKESEEEVWEKLAESNDNILIINSNVIVDFNHLQILAKEVPTNYNLIGLSSKQNNIKHPFRFSKNLEFVHPDMHEFSGYLLSKKGALMLLKNREYKNRNLMLSREHHCFAYKHIILKDK